MISLISMMITGLVIGAIAKLIMPGKDPGGIVLTAIIGMVGMLIGAFIGRKLLGYGAGYTGNWALGIVGALILLGAYRVVAGRRSE